jgi:hypothetical protein
MSIQPVSSGQPGATSSGASGASSVTSNGVSSLGSSISSSGAAANQGCSAQISAWVAGFFDAIRSCLATIPCIGNWFANAATTTGSTTSSGSTTSGSSTTWTNPEIVAMIRGVFVPASGITTGQASPAVPAADVVAYTLGLFGQISTPAAKIEALQTVFGAINSTDDIAKQFYNALPEGALTEDQLNNNEREATRKSLRREIWEANGRVTTWGTHAYNLNFGDHIINNVTRGPLVQQALHNLRNRLAASGSSTTGTSTTGP